MPDLTDRVIRLEARADERDRTMDYLRVEMIELRRSMEALGTELRAEMTTFRSEVRIDLGSVRAEMAAMRESFDRRFTWLVGLMVGGFVAVIAAVLQN